MKYTHIYPLPLTSWHIIIVCQKEMGHRVETVQSEKQTFDLKINRGPPGVTLNTCVKYHHCMPKGNWVIKQKRKTNCKKFSPNLTLIFNLSTPKRERSFSGHGQYICEVSLLYAKNKWISCGNDTKFKDQIWSVLWSFDPKINSGPSQVEVNTFVKYHHCIINGRGVILQKPLFSRTDRWTDRQLWWNQYTSKTSLAGLYKLIFNVEKSLKNDPPGSQNFMGESLFHNLWLKI